MPTLHQKTQFATVVDLLRERVQTHGDLAAFTFLWDGETEEASLTYAQLDVRARAVAAWLQAAGAAGQRVLLLHRPGLEYIVGFFGCLYAGAAAVPAYPPRHPQMLQQLQAIARDAGATLALTDDLVLAQVGAGPAAQLLRWASTEQIGAEWTTAWQPPDLTGDSLAFVQYTSGSTGTPKGVMVSHTNLLHNTAGCHQMMDLQPTDRVVSWLPLYHDMGLITAVVAPLYAGIPSFIMSPEAFLQRPMRWLEAMSRYRATASGSPNFGFDLALLKSTPEERAALDLSAWRVAFNGAEPVRAETLGRFAAAFAPAGFSPQALLAGYGLAEATLIVSAGRHAAAPVVREVSRTALEQNRVEPARAGDPDLQRLVGCGQALPGMQIAIVHPERRTALAAGAVGEIWVAGPSVARGYWNRPEATAQAFGAYLADSEAGPFLRTGDLGFLDEQGELFITGRIKELIIVRGRNHYPQDLEKTAESAWNGLMPGAGAAFTVEAEGGERLVLALEVKPDFHGEPAAVFDAVRQAVSRNHELQVHAVVLVQPGGLPRTMSGKVQRFGARAAFSAGSLPAIASSLDAARQTESPVDTDTVEGAIQMMVAAALKVPAAQVDPARSLSAHGLDSLAAVELTHKIEAKYGVTLPLELLLQGPTLRSVAAQVETLITTAVAATKGAAVGEGDFPLSHGQAAIWFLYRMAPESAAYNIARALRVHNPVDVEAFRLTVQQLADRHPALRTTFHEGPVQRVHAQAQAIFAVEPEPADLQARLEAESLRPFNLEQGPLMRIYLFRRPDGSGTFHFAMHHIIGDLWSLTVFMQELGQLYAAHVAGTTLELPPVPARYTDHVAAQRTLLESEDGERLLGYWKERLAGELPALGLPADRPRPAVQSYAGGMRTLTLDAGLAGKLTKLGRKHGATPFATLLAAYQAFLHRYTGQEDIIVGSPTAGRSRSELAGVMGYFVNPVALRSRVEGARPFTEFLTAVKENVVSALAHASYPFPLLVDRLQVPRDPSRTPVYQTMFVLQRAHRRQEFNGIALAEPGTRFDLGGMELESLPVWQQAATCDLTLFAAEVEGEFRLQLEYNADLFDAATVDRMLSHFRTLITAVVAAPETPIDRLPLMEEAERQQLLVEWNRTEAAYPSAQTLSQLFEAQAASTPDAIAVGPDMTYAELNRRANRLARHLQDLGVGPDVLVGVCLERTPELPVALLAVLKAGGAYLPLDPAYPRERLGFMLADAQAPVLLTAAHLLDRLPEHAARVICDFDCDASDANLQASAGPDNLAYVIYTSGSTGRPKGAMIHHRGLVNYLWWAKTAYQVEAGSGAPVHSSVSFDLTVTSLWTPLIAGRRVDLVPEALGIEGLSGALKEPGGYSLVKLTPAHVELISRQLTPAQAARGAGALVIGGEALLPETIAFWRQAAPGTALINEYGPTETVVGCCVYWVKPGEEFRGSIPIGRPIANTKLYILDRHLEPMPVGVAGELYIGGDGVCRGYLNRPELTAERFLETPLGRLYKTGDLCRYLPDGTIDFLGRIDEQVKLRGFRIELGEIETGLAAHPTVQTAAAVVRDGKAGKQLVAYVVPRPGQSIDVTALKAHLRDRVPEYMVPTAFVTMAELPLSPNGKVDRKALPAPEAQPQHVTAPRTPVEAQLAAIWAEVLRLPAVGVDANFFELGGDSILSIQVVSKASQAGLKLTPRDLFQHPTVAGLAGVAELATGAPQADQGPVVGPVSLAPIQRWFLEADPVDAHHYSQSVLLEVRRPLDPAVLESALNRLVEHHDALRFRFRRRPDGTWEQTCAAPGEKVTLGGPEPDLENGPLLKAELTGNRLQLSIHHLAVDGVSWRILLEDLELLCHNPTAPLPPKTASYRDWAATQAEVRIHAGAINPANTVESEAAVTLTLTAADTATLLREAAAAYRMKPDEVMLTALTRAFGGVLEVSLEGHGRDGSLDLSRTVGWFTAIDPVRLEAAPGTAPVSALKQVKEQVRRRSPAVAPDVSFNYLGRMEAAGTALFAPVAGAGGLDRSPRQHRRHRFEIDAVVAGDRLQIRWAYSRNLDDRAGIEAIAGAFRRELFALIAHIAAPDAGGFTPSDFPLAGLDQDRLDSLTGMLTDRLGLPVREALQEIEEITALTPLQQEMLGQTLLAPASGVWTVQTCVALEGRLDRTAMAEAWRGLTDRCCQLRSIFAPGPSGRAVRIAWRRGRTPLQSEDWRGAGAAEQKLSAFLHEDRQHGFRFMEQPPVRCTLIRPDEQSHWLVLTFHHLLLDGWSTSLLFRELLERYAAITGGHSLRLMPGRPYADFVRWWQERDRTADMQYWRGRLAGYQPPAPLGAGPARGPVMVGAHRDLALSPEATSSLNHVARRYGVTLATLVQGAWALLVSGLAEQNDLVWGSVHAGRPAELPGAEEMIGLFMNTVPVRTTLRPDQSVSQWLAALQASVQEDAQHGQISPQEAARWAGLSASAPLFESAVFFENYPVDPALKDGIAGLKLTDVRFHEQHHYPLSLIAVPGERLALQLLYHVSRFSAAAAAACAQRLEKILLVLAEGEDQPLATLIDIARPIDRYTLSVGE